MCTDDETFPSEYLGAADQRRLLCLARETLQSYLYDGSLPEVQPASLSPALLQTACCFVTLRRHGQLRGCIGQIASTQPLYAAVMDSAISAATRDHRFAPVREDELPELTLHISVLTPARPLSCACAEELYEQLEPGVHGVILRNGWMCGLYLPQVWAHFDDEPDPKAAFLTSLSHKAGDPSGTIWRHPDTTFEVFEAIGFGDEEHEL